VYYITINREQTARTQSREKERKKDMRYIVENRETEEVIKIFDSEEERNEWINKKCTSFNDGVFIAGTEIRISCYEE
jgi:hypothetical protein